MFLWSVFSAFRFPPFIFVSWQRRGFSFVALGKTRSYLAGDHPLVFSFFSPFSLIAPSPFPFAGCAIPLRLSIREKRVVASLSLYSAVGIRFFTLKGHSPAYWKNPVSQN